ncbi:hypothetical protein AA0115_g7200 [Alternaria tenuissima]|nr:hypothetical protein AA0115_g7200 [Alternaria tenuissima]
MAASGNGVNANTIVGIVYGTLMLAIACTQLFFEYRKFRSSSGSEDAGASGMELNGGPVL